MREVYRETNGPSVRAAHVERPPVQVDSRGEDPVILTTSEAERVIPEPRGLIVLIVDKDNFGRAKGLVAIDYDPGIPIGELAWEAGVTQEQTKRYLAEGLEFLWQRQLSESVRRELLEDRASMPGINPFRLMQLGLDQLDLKGKLLGR